MKKRHLPAMIGLFLWSGFAVSAQYIVKVTEKVDTYTYSEAKEFSGWVASGDPYDCSEWAPKPIEVNIEQAFTQTKTCSQSFTQTEYTYKVNEQTGDKELLNSELVSKVDTVSSTQPSVGIYTVRNMCSDIRSRNPSSANGNYYVDQDGIGPIAPKRVYCDMSGGGWTLYEDFGTKGGRYAYNHGRIYNSSTLTAAGYSFNAPHLNNGAYYLNENYMSAFYSSTPEGWLQKDMPSWVKGVRVRFKHAYQHGYAKVSLGSQSKVISPGQTATATFSGTGRLRMSEYPTSIIWIDAVWVK